MKPNLIILALCSLAVPAVAELPPTLKPHADKIEADRAALTASAENFLKPARDRYLTVLASAEKAATVVGKRADSVAIAAEMRDVGAGAAAVEEFPPDLPRSLSQQRRDYMTAVATVAKTIPAKLPELTTKYLQAIAAFESSALKPTDATVIAAVAAERQRVMELVEAAGSARKYQNVVTNSDLSKGEP